MDIGYQLKHENPKKDANCLSKMFFTWMIRLFYKGSQKGLEIIDLYKTLESDRSDKLGDRLEKYWNQEMKNLKVCGKKPSLMRALMKAFALSYIMWGLIMFFQMVFLKSIQPVVLAFLIKLFVTPGEDDLTKKMYISGAVLVGISFVSVVLAHHQNFNFSSSGMRVRIAVSSLVYRKITRLDQKALGQTAAGYVVNLLSNDVSRFDLVVLVIHALWIMPFQVLLVSYFIWREVGISSLAGILSMVLLTLPIQAYLGKLTGKLRYKIARKTDKRVGMMNEIISGIQVIKMYAWEKPFEKMVRLARSTEISDIRKTSYLRGILASCMVFVERSTLCFTVICYVLLGHVITADKVFSMAQFFNVLQLAMAIYYPQAIAYGAETLVSIKRLQEFLVLEEKQTSTIETRNDNGIQFTNVSASWKSSSTLQGITLNIPPGQLCAVVGPVGAGKSSLLQLLLGELPIISGKIYLGGEISYSSQEPWLFASSVRTNILFGQAYNKPWYRKVVKVCALERDFEQFPLGDRTTVGDRGVSLSGGQRARINLARAIYRQADIYLLDDPLSAVDTHVGKQLFEECILKHLKGKTRILVTHQLQYVKKANQILVLNEGRIEALGTFEELSNSDLDFTKMLVAADQTQEKQEDKEEMRYWGDLDPRRPSILSTDNTTLSESIEILQQNEENEEQIVVDPSLSPLKEYFNATKNICLMFLLVLILIFAQSACAGADFWVAFWTQQEQIRHSNDSHMLESTVRESNIETVEIYNTENKNLPNYTYKRIVNETPPSHTFSFDSFFDKIEVKDITYNLLKSNIAMYFYGALIAAAIVLTIGRSLLFFKIAMMASKNLHSKMFHCLLRAPMRFFDTNPSGRVLNRFSKDMGAIDEILPRVLLDAIQVTLVMCGILVNIGVSNPYAIVAMIFCGALFWKIREWYILTAKDIKHLEGVAKSPVFSHVNSTLNGMTTIRASNAEDILIGEFDHHQNVHTSAWYLTITCMVSFGLWLDLVCVIFIACVTFSFVILHNYSAVSGSLVGLAISQSLILTGMLQHGIRQTAEVVNQLTSVERVLQYTTIDPEGQLETSKDKLPNLPWPNKGLIEFKNLSLRYAEDDPPVLNNLNFVIYPGEKIGIVGRTGAGKSSLIAALFRITPLEGSIVIDGEDIKDLGLTDLRKKISIIPQEPVLFSATMRYNLDPFDEFDDARLWKALEDVELRDVIPSLNFMVSEGGNNLSLGQRQLICLARAILRNNKILVLDEATANVDPRTDSFIQATIRKKFKSCTVLTVAHRLNTIMDSDRVIVMSFGSIVEFDHPHNLMQIPEGYFSKMVEETGSTMTLQLKDIAMEAYNRKLTELEE